MATDPQARNAVRVALLAAFPERADLDSMVRRGLGRNLNEIASEKVGLEAAVDRLLDWAEAEGRFPEDLLGAALGERPGNDKLLTAVRAYAAPKLRFGDLALRLAPPPPPLPERPYPLLEPYTHPDTFTGRTREIAGALSELRAPPLLLCIHGASGTGKSSFLQAGLLPELRRQGVPVVLNSRPDEAGIARRLATGLLVLPEGSRLADDEPLGFAHLLDGCETRAGKAPVIVLDQFEDVFRRSESGAALARLGPLLAASTELAEPQGQGFRCRWVLSYRQEYRRHDSK